MDNYWATRQRSTNKLVRICYQYLVDKRRLTAETIHGLCKLTWITRSYEGPEAGYLWRTKLPGLGVIFNADYSGWSLDEVADDVMRKLGSKNKQTRNLITGETGFTNFRYTYRNSALGWVRRNQNALKSILHRSYKMTSKTQGKGIVASIAVLPKIPSPSGSNMASVELMMTPLCFAIAEKMLFPIINGSNHVNLLLQSVGAKSAPLTEQYLALTALIGKKGIKDAADLDTRAIELAGTEPVKGSQIGRKLTVKERDLPPKDEKEYQVLQKSLQKSAVRTHNTLTNKLLKYYGAEKKLREGAGSNRFDVLIPEYDKDGDLLVEVKSSTNIADVRMAIGQLYDYHRKIENQENTNIAVLLPKYPNEDVRELLAYADIGLLYFNGNELEDEWW